MDKVYVCYEQLSYKYNTTPLAVYATEEAAIAWVEANQEDRFGSNLCCYTEADVEDKYYG